MSSRWLGHLHDNPIEWLLAGNPWKKHMTMVELLDMPRASGDVIGAKKEMMEHPLVLELAQEAQNWFSYPLKRHDDAKMSHYQLKILADFGFSESDQVIKALSQNAMSHVENGTFAIKQAIPEKGQNLKLDETFNEWHSLPCDAPLISSTLYRLGNRSEALLESIDIIKERWRADSGWFCHLFFVEGHYKKHPVGCMMAGLEALELFSLFQNSNEVHVEEEILRNAYQPLQFHRDYGKSLYYFGRSKRFWSLKYPFVWYNALYVADVLSRFEVFRKEKLLQEIVDWILASQDDDGRFRPTSMFRHYKNWDFANKKEPSPWITLLCCKILKQYFS